MVETIKRAYRKASWRLLPCPACGEKGFLKDFLNGFPGEAMDESKHIYGGCLPEYWSRAEVACVKCNWEGSKDEVRNFASPFVTLSTRFVDALAYSNFHHAKQSRKGTSIAYISHPIGVAGLIIEAGGAEDLAIAGLLHDVPEDCGGEPRLVEIKEKFGSRVEEIVRACSHALPEEGEEKAPWPERKLAHLEELRNKSDDVLVVTAADKTHNARAIASDLAVLGSGVWKQFNASREEILWYYDEVFHLLYVRNVPPYLLVPLHAAIEIMKSEPIIFRPYGDGSI
jgi:hypothetical protein